MPPEIATVYSENVRPYRVNYPTKRREYLMRFILLPSYLQKLTMYIIRAIMGGIRTVANTML
jgi:hypothetical protein